jgi:hypothetical protein
MRTAREVVEVARAARGDDGHVHDAAHGAEHLEVETLLRPVRVDRREQDLPGPGGRCLRRPARHGPLRDLPAAVRRDHHLHAALGATDSLAVDREHHALPAELRGEPREEGRVVHRGRVDGHAVRSRAEERVGVLDRPHAPADRERDREDVRDPADEPEERASPLDGRRDVEERDLVRTLVLVADGGLDRVAGVPQLLKGHALDDAPARNVEARDHAHGERHAATASRANLSAATVVAPA